ncbi:hypothetical protein ACOME3_005209 [Neoechinorhynchus agilis]
MKKEPLIVVNRSKHNWQVNKVDVERHGSNLFEPRIKEIDNDIVTPSDEFVKKWSLERLLKFINSRDYMEAEIQEIRSELNDSEMIRIFDHFITTALDVTPRILLWTKMYEQHCVDVSESHERTLKSLQDSYISALEKAAEFIMFSAISGQYPGIFEIDAISEDYEVDQTDKVNDFESINKFMVGNEIVINGLEIGELFLKYIRMKAQELAILMKLTKVAESTSLMITNTKILVILCSLLFKTR